MGRRDGGGDALDVARVALRAALPAAAETLVELLKSEDPNLRLRAAAAILNRCGLTEAKSVGVSWAEQRVGGENPLARLL